MTTKTLHRLFLSVACCAGAIAGGMAATIYVDDDPNPCTPKDGTLLCPYESVQVAITAANPLDTIEVACGTYFENIFMRDEISVIGAGAECTTLDGNAAGSVVTFDAVGATTTLSGFTIRNGLSNQGAGIFMDDSQATVTRTIITGNAAILDGGGYLGYGGGISIYNSAPTISSSLIVGNTAERTGAALDMYFGYPTIVGNTIVGNAVIRPGASVGYGGGIYGLFSDPTVLSNIIHGNDAEGGGGGIDLVNSAYTVEYNNLNLNTPANWHCMDNQLPCTTNPSFPFPPGNTDAAPLLEGPVTAARFCPRSDSPAVDGGPSPAPASAPGTDFFGRARVQDGDFDGTALMDLGYCETDEITRIQVATDETVSWDPSGNGSAVFHLYRGLLSTLAASCATDCVYSQVPGGAGVRRECSLATPSFADPDRPAQGDSFYYLVTGDDAAEGSLGWRLPGGIRDHDNPCP